MYLPIRNKKIKIRHKRNNEKRLLTAEEFCKEFDGVLKIIFNNYKQDATKYFMHKYTPSLYYVYKSKLAESSIKRDFVADLRFQFNHSCLSEWYIEQFI